MSAPVYLDYNATTPIDPRVVEAMLPHLREHFGNPSSSHPFGQRAREAVAQARAEVAGLINAAPEEVVFTGSATEANNLALLGTARAYRDRGKHLVTSAIEHPAVAEPLKRLAAEGWEVSVVPVDRRGRVDPEQFAAVLRPDTVLASVMHANNEVGTVQPIAELAALAGARGVLFHSDAAQSAGKVPVDVAAMGVDLLTLAGHKCYAPKGVGALFVRAGLRLEPPLVGAGQEHGLRPGTENVPYLVAFGAAARLAREGLAAGEAGRLESLRDQLHRGLAAAIPGLTLNGDPEHRLPNTLHLSFPGVSASELLRAVEAEVAASAGAACHSGHGAVSGVLAAMGASTAEAEGAVRLSVGRFTSEAELTRAAAAVIRAWNALRGTG